jgi:hypothetical protein
VSSPGTCWASTPVPPSLLNVGVATCCNHLLQLLAACMRVRSGGATNEDSSCPVGQRGPRVDRRVMQVLGEDGVQARGKTKYKTHVAIYLPYYGRLYRQHIYIIRVKDK